MNPTTTYLKRCEYIHTLSKKVWFTPFTSSLTNHPDDDNDDDNDLNSTRFGTCRPNWDYFGTVIRSRIWDLIAAPDDGDCDGDGDGSDSVAHLCLWTEYKASAISCITIVRYIWKKVKPMWNNWQNHKYGARENKCEYKCEIWNMWKKTCHNSDWRRWCLTLIYLRQLPGFSNARNPIQIQMQIQINTNTNQCKYKSIHIQINANTNQYKCKYKHVIISSHNSDWRRCHRCTSCLASQIQYK